MAVVVVIGTVQLIAAICTATSMVSILRGIPQEVFGFGAVAAGYCSLYAGERIFPTSLAKALSPSITLGLCLAALFSWLVPQHAALPLAAFACAAAGRLLQRVEIPFLWFAGTALPLLMAWALFGPLISGWQFPWLVWVGLTVSCKALRERSFCRGFCISENARPRSPRSSYNAQFLRKVLCSRLDLNGRSRVGHGSCSPGRRFTMLRTFDNSYRSINSIQCSCFASAFGHVPYWNFRCPVTAASSTGRCNAI
jgi:hypothetical protein